VENSIGPWEHGPFTYVVEELPRTGDRYELMFTVEQEGLSLGSGIASLTRSAESIAVSRAPNGASDTDTELWIRTRLREEAKTRLEELLDHSADSLAPGTPVRLLDITSSDDDLIDKLVRSGRPG
jgi:hypothetical protein